LLINIDLSISVRQQVPILLDKLASTPMFVTGNIINASIVIQ